MNLTFKPLNQLQLPWLSLVCSTNIFISLAYFKSTSKTTLASTKNTLQDSPTFPAIVPSSFYPGTTREFIFPFCICPVPSSILCLHRNPFGMDHTWVSGQNFASFSPPSCSFLLSFCFVLASVTWCHCHLSGSSLSVSLFAVTLFFLPLFPIFWNPF